MKCRANPSVLVRAAVATFAAMTMIAACSAAKPASHPASPSLSTKPVSRAELPSLTRRQSLEMCAGLRTGILAHEPNRSYASEILIAWNELRKATTYQAQRAVIVAAETYCPDITIKPLPASDLTLDALQAMANGS